MQRAFFSNKLVLRICTASRDSELLFRDSHEQVDLNLFPSSLMLDVSYSVGS